MVISSLLAPWVLKLQCFCFVTTIMLRGFIIKIQQIYNVMIHVHVSNVTILQ